MFLVWPTKFEKYFEFYAQLICCLKKKREIVWNLNFWQNWVLNLGFVKIISSHTNAFFFIFFQCFEERLHQILLFFKNSFFLQFRLIEKQTRLIKIVKKKWIFENQQNLMQPLLKALKNYEENAWVWDEMIFTNPRFKTQFSQKFRFQTISLCFFKQQISCA